MQQNIESKNDSWDVLFTPLENAPQLLSAFREQAGVVESRARGLMPRVSSLTGFNEEVSTPPVNPAPKKIVNSISTPQFTYSFKATKEPLIPAVTNIMKEKYTRQAKEGTSSTGGASSILAVNRLSKPQSSVPLVKPTMGNNTVSFGKTLPPQLLFHSSQQKKLTNKQIILITTLIVLMLLLGSSFMFCKVKSEVCASFYTKAFGPFRSLFTFEVLLPYKPIAPTSEVPVLEAL